MHDAVFLFQPLLIDPLHIFENRLYKYLIQNLYKYGKKKDKSKKEKKKEFISPLGIKFKIY